MKRNLERKLNSWLESSRRKPLILRGARQVGKSTLVRNFCKNNRLDLIEINFEKTIIDEINKEKNYSITKILRDIESITEKRITKNSLLFFDEIQESPLAIAKLRYFYEDKPEIPIIAAGSLLEFTLKSHNFSMPVGRIQYLYLGPMTFFEYLEAIGKVNLLENIKNSFPNYPTKTQHELLVDFLKEYLYIGGMPEAVKVFKETDSFLEVKEVHKEIITTYQDDFPKYNKSKTLDFLNATFKHVATSLGKTIKHSDIATAKSREINKSIELLSNAKIISNIKYTNSSGLPLSIGEKKKKDKLYFLDVGLANHFQGLTWTDINSIDSDKNLSKGHLAEQFVAQHLLYRKDGSEIPELHYWFRDAKNSSAEIDFIIKQQSMIIPVEVKAGKTGSIKSLLIFTNEKKSEYAIRLDLKYRESNIEKLKSDTTLLNLPLYYVELIEKLKL